MKEILNRRKFIKDLSVLSGGFFIGKSAFSNPTEDERLKSQKMVVDVKFDKNLEDKNPLRFAFIGCGGRAEINLDGFANVGQKISAFCDVHEHRSEKGIKAHFNGQPIYKDYRIMLEKERKNIDAVVISTPDISHFAAAMCAIKMGLPVYLEKPLCHTIYQIRTLCKAASDAKVATQMGNQSHSKDGINICKEWIDAGLIGTVNEVVLWTDRPLSGIKCNGLVDWPKQIDVPAGLDWDLWQNVLETDVYRENIVPSAWRSWWKYGSGSLGDIGCHMLDIPMYALNLGIPSKVVSKQRNDSQICTAPQDMVEYYFDTSSQGAKVKLSWHSGVAVPRKRELYPNYDTSFLPKLPKEYTDTGRSYEQLADNGQFIIGTKGVIYVPTMHLGGAPVLLPKTLWMDVKNNLPAPKIRYEGGNHYLNFVRAIKGEEKASSSFDVAGLLTEVVQLGNLSLQTRSDIVWDAKNMHCKDNPKANALVSRPMRNGWF